MLVWGLTGFWRSASQTFLLWGLYYGVLLTLEKFVFHLYPKRSPSVACMMPTSAIVMLGWVLFASSGLFQTVVYYRQLFTAAHGVVDRQTLSLLVNYGFWLCAATVLSTRAPFAVSSNLIYTLCRQQWFLKPVLVIVMLVILPSYPMLTGYQSLLYVQFQGGVAMEIRNAFRSYDIISTILSCMIGFILLYFGHQDLAFSKKENRAL